MVTKKWFGHHWNIVLLATEISLVTISQLVSITFNFYMDSWPICNQFFFIALKLEEWQPMFFSHQQLSAHFDALPSSS
jgi:hypothetical protein